MGEHTGCPGYPPRWLHWLLLVKGFPALCDLLPQHSLFPWTCLWRSLMESRRPRGHMGTQPGSGRDPVRASGPFTCTAPASPHHALGSPGPPAPFEGSLPCPPHSSLKVVSGRTARLSLGSPCSSECVPAVPAGLCLESCVCVFPPFQEDRPRSCCPFGAEAEPFLFLLDLKFPFRSNSVSFQSIMYHVSLPHVSFSSFPNLFFKLPVPEFCHTSELLNSALCCHFRSPESVVIFCNLASCALFGTACDSFARLCKRVFLVCLRSGFPLLPQLFSSFPYLMQRSRDWGCDPVCQNRGQPCLQLHFPGGHHLDAYNDPDQHSDQTECPFQESESLGVNGEKE